MTDQSTKPSTSGQWRAWNAALSAQPLSLHYHEPRLLQLALLLLTAPFAGCSSAHIESDRSVVAHKLQTRTGQTISVDNGPGQLLFPPGTSLEDGLPEEEAIAIALWHNAALAELLVDLGIARADLIQAGLLPNPEGAYFFHVAGKPFKYAFDLPIEAFWLRPIRLKVAGWEAQRISDRLVQSGLDLIRDVRQAYADVLLARERLQIAEETVRLRQRIAELAEKRLKAGDASPQEVAPARIDALRAEQDAVRTQFEIPIVEERLRNLLGIGEIRDRLILDSSIPTPREQLDAELLTTQAVSTRPDAQAAEAAVTAAKERLQLARLGWVRFLGIADATSGTLTGHELGPAFRFTLPVFNWNQGGIARAEAEVERAVRQQQTLHNQIILEVRRAHAQYLQARSELDVLKEKVRPEVETAIHQTQKAYEEGNTSYLLVLETTRQLLDSSLREAQLYADLRRTWAELERSVGHHLDAVSNPSQTPPFVEPSTLAPKDERSKP
jgi:cobalt-zinc-cadmium efflux system outer membrane protein